MSRLRWVALASCVALLSVSCAGAPPATQPPTAAPTEAPGTPAPGETTTPTPEPTPDAREVALTFARWTSGNAVDETYEQFIAAYVASDPRVTSITQDMQPFNRYTDVLNVKLAGGQPPDIAWIPFNLAPAYIDAGALLDLRPYLEAVPDYDYDDLRPSALEPWSRGDAVYGIPFTNSTNVVYYNIDMFEAAGVKTPAEMIADGEWTWENVREISKQITDSGAARFGFMFGNNIFVNGWRILEDIWAPYGGGPWTEDGGTCRFNAPETVEATDVVWHMIYTDRSHPEPGVEVSFFPGDSVAMTLMRPSQVVNLADATFRWDVAPQPSGPLGYVPAAATNGITVLANGPNPDIAAEVVAFFTTVENSKIMGANFPSARISLQTAAILKEVNPLFTEEQLQETVIAAISAPNASWGYAHPNFGPVNSNAQRVIDGQLWRPDADVQAALDATCQEIVDLLG